MEVLTETIEISTNGDTSIHNITDEAEKIVRKSRMDEGMITLFVSGSTAGITTVEYEPGLIKDLKEFFEKIIPKGVRYHHDDTWHDGNGHSHIRSALLKTSLSVPFKNKEMVLGTWQQLILIDFDNRPRKRKVVAQVIGT